MTMFEAKIKENRRYYVVVDGERFRIRTFEQAVHVGQKAVKGGYPGARLVEEYDLFKYAPGAGWKHIDHQEFDRTTLLEN